MPCLRELFPSHISLPTPLKVQARTNAVLELAPEFAASCDQQLAVAKLEKMLNTWNDLTAKPLVITILDVADALDVGAAGPVRFAWKQELLAVRTPRPNLLRGAQLENVRVLKLNRLVIPQRMKPQLVPDKLGETRGDCFPCQPYLLRAAS